MTDVAAAVADKTKSGLGGRSRRNADGASIQSVARALTLLETIAELGGETTLSRLASRTGLNISTCHHLLATLVQRGFVTKAPGRRGYALGARILYLSHICLQVDLPKRALSAVDRINQATGETVHLAALHGDELVTVMKREARHAVRVDAGAIGTANAAHATATGKSMLAWLPDHEIRRILAAHGMTQFTRLVEQLSRMALPTQAPGQRQGQVPAQPPGQGAPAAAGDLKSRLVTLAARSARDEGEFAAYKENLRSLGVEAELVQVLRQLSQQLPAWTLPRPGPQAGAQEAPLTRTAEAIRRVVTVEQDPRETSRRFEELVRVAVEQFNGGLLPRAVTMLDLASLMISGKKIDAAFVQRFLEHAHEALDPSRLRKFADDPESQPSLRRVLEFFPAFAPDCLLDALQVEEKRERRRLFLALLETHGEAVHTLAFNRLTKSVDTFGDGDAHFQRNLLYLIRRIPKPAEVPLDAEVQVAVRLSILTHPLLLVKEAIAFLGQVRSDRAERALVSRLTDIEGALLKPSSTAHDAPELISVLDRAVFTLARLGTQGALRAVVEHGIKRQAQLGETGARLAALATVDLASDPVAVDRLAKAIREAMPHKVLGIVVSGHEKQLVELIEASAGTTAPAIRDLLKEIADRFPGQDCGEVAARILSAGPAVAAPREEAKGASLSGDLELFGLPTLLQNLAQSTLTGVLTITDPVGDLAATITLEGGKLRACTVGHLEGEAAVYQLFERPTSGSFSFLDLRATDSAQGAATPPRELVPLFFEGTRRYDELQQACMVVPDYAVLKATSSKPTGLSDEHDKGLMRTVWERVISGEAALACEAGLPVDAYRVRRLLAHWFQEGSLEPR